MSNSLITHLIAHPQPFKVSTKEILKAMDGISITPSVMAPELTAFQQQSRASRPRQEMQAFHMEYQMQLLRERQANLRDTRDN